MPVQDLARESVVTADRDTTAESIARTLRDENVGSVVITNGGSPVGIVTDRDVALSVVADGQDPGAVAAADIMTEDVITAEASEGTFELCSAMCENGVRRMPVTEDGELVGIVTLDDMLQLLAEEFQNLSTVVAKESPPY